MQHLSLQIAVHLVERKLHEAAKSISPRLNHTFRNHFDSIGIGAIKSDGRNVAAVPGLANAVVEQSWRQELGGRLQGNRVIAWSQALPQLSQSIDKGLHRLGSKTILAQRILKGTGRGREIDAGQRTGSLTLRSN